MTKAPPNYQFAHNATLRPPTQQHTVTTTRPNTSSASATKEIQPNYIDSVILTTCETDGPPPMGLWYNPKDPSCGYRAIHYFDHNVAKCGKHGDEDTMNATQYEAVPYDPDSGAQIKFDPSVGYPNEDVASLPQSALERSAAQHQNQSPPYTENSAVAETCDTQGPTFAFHIDGDAKTNEELLD